MGLCDQVTATTNGRRRRDTALGGGTALQYQREPNNKATDSHDVRLAKSKGVPQLINSLVEFAYIKIQGVGDGIGQVF